MFLLSFIIIFVKVGQIIVITMITIITIIIITVNSDLKKQEETIIIIKAMDKLVILSKATTYIIIEVEDVIIIEIIIYT
jgi:hypothetical protein